MNSTTIKWLAAAAVALLALMFVVDLSDRNDTVAGAELLLPGFREQLNDVDRIVVTGNGEADVVTVERDGEDWTVLEKGGFDADIGKLRELLLAMADARKLEQKTSNPERLPLLGLDGPDSGSGTKLEIAGEDFSYTLIIGNTAQSKNRYVRMADDNQAWLIDKNPELPASGGGWLATELLDIEASRIRSVSVQHDDGETISISKEAVEDSNFTVEDIPAGRELSYATVANGMAGVLKDLALEDVRPALELDPVSTTVFTTFDGLVVTVRRYQDAAVVDGDEGDAWFAIDADVLPPAVAEAMEPVAGEAIADNVAIDDTSGEEPAAAPDESSPEEIAADLNARRAGWQYKVPGYKANLIARRWDDILKAPEE
ncbi:MAG: DUF4340 domain-containing protein [Woeseiaceae bacterium]